MLSGTGAIEWRPAEAAPLSYEFLGPNGERTVIDSRDDDGHAPYDLIVYSPAGESVGRLAWTERRPNIQMPDAARERNLALQKVYELARDKVTGAADVVQSVIDSLPPEDDEIPF